MSASLNSAMLVFCFVRLLVRAYVLFLSFSLRGLLHLFTFTRGKKKSTQNLLKIDMLSRIYACYRLSIPSQMTMVYHKRCALCMWHKPTLQQMTLFLLFPIDLALRSDCLALLCPALCSVLLLQLTLLCSAPSLFSFIHSNTIPPEFGRSISGHRTMRERHSMCVCVCDVVFLLTFFRCSRQFAM